MIIRSFVPNDEKVIAAEFVGTFGLLLKEHAFFAVTDRRAISITFAPFGRWRYQDGLLEHVNSSGIGQPSQLFVRFATMVLAIYAAGATLASVAWFVNSDGTRDVTARVLLTIASIITTWLLFLVLRGAVRTWWMRKRKAGIFLVVRDGAPITTFVDTNSLPTAMAAYRDFSLARDDRLAKLR